MLDRHGLTPSFYESGDGHRDDREHEADADSLEVADAGGDAGEASREGDEDAVVDGDEEHHEDEGNDGEGGGGDAEVAGDAGVHGGALLDREGLELSQANVHAHGAEDYGHHS